MIEALQYRLKIKDLPEYERPYEKLELQGAQALSNAELLAIIIKVGSKHETSVSLAQRILMQDECGEGLPFLYDVSLEQLQSIKGIGRVKAIQIKALMEFSKRAATSQGINRRMTIKSHEDIGRLLMEEMRYLKKEVFKAVMMNIKNQVLRQVNISIGSMTESVVHPREVFSEAVKSGCSRIILAHNHPSGDPQPSREDIATTQRLAAAGELMGIPILDHVIIGNGKYVSLKEKGYL